MPSGFLVGGVDLDSIFALRGGNTPVANTGFQVDGVDLAQRYAGVSFGVPADNATSYKTSGGTDLQNVFAKIGSLVLELTISGDNNFYDVLAEAEAIVGVGNVPNLVEVTVEGTARVSKITSGALPGTWKLTINSGGLVLGRIGDQGLVDFTTPFEGGDGGVGGNAIETTVSVEIVNNGTIGAGGGGGGGGGTDQGNPLQGEGGLGGTGAGWHPILYWSSTAGGNGANGTDTGAGVAGVGGSGGADGVNGADGTNGTAATGAAGGGGGGGGGMGATGGGGGASSRTDPGGAGGLPGSSVAISSGKSITWTVTGTVFGATSIL